MTLRLPDDLFKVRGSVDGLRERADQVKSSDVKSRHVTSRRASIREQRHGAGRGEGRGG